jgi:surface polysaccharide O-acyltransferase-like enzyme
VDPVHVDMYLHRVPPNWPVEVLRDGVWQTLYPRALANLHILETQNIRLFLDGKRPVWHLWFLPALMFSLAILTLVRLYGLQKYLIWMIMSLYALILAEEAAGGALFNSTVHLGWWLIAIILTSIGWLLVERRQPSTSTVWGLILGGYAFALFEGAIITTVLHNSPQAIHKHLFLGGVAISQGMFLLSLAKPELGRSTALPFLGKFTLGIYGSHYFVFFTLNPILWRVRGNGLLGEMFIALVVYTSSVLFTVGLSKVPIARHLVMKPVWRRQGTVNEGRQLTDKKLQIPGNDQILP